MVNFRLMRHPRTTSPGTDVGIRFHRTAAVRPPYCSAVERMLIEPAIPGVWGRFRARAFPEKTIRSGPYRDGPGSTGQGSLCRGQGPGGRQQIIHCDHRRTLRRRPFRSRGRNQRAARGRGGSRPIRGPDRRKPGPCQARHAARSSPPMSRNAPSAPCSTRRRSAASSAISSRSWPATAACSPFPT